jgi:hypothetical protein
MNTEGHVNMKQRKVKITMGCGHGSEVCDDMTEEQLGYLEDLGFCENCFEKAKTQLSLHEEVAHNA